MNVDQSISRSFKVLGIYQIAGGMVGLGLFVIMLAGLRQFSLLLVGLFVIALFLFTYSVVCGIMCVKGRSSALTHSLINQLLQLFTFSVAGLSFKYTSGIFFTVGVDLTKSFFLTLDAGISNWNMEINGDRETFSLGVNIVALVLISFIIGLKNKLQIQRSEKILSGFGANAL